MPKVELDTLPIYDDPDAIAEIVGDLGQFVGRAISQYHGLRNLGANVETLMPGARSSHRHWHDKNDELVVVLTGELMLVEDGETTKLVGGEIAVFPAGVENGHCLENRSSTSATFLVVGTRLSGDRCFYADVDIVLHPDGTLTRRNGAPVG